MALVSDYLGAQIGFGNIQLLSVLDKNQAVCIVLD